MGADGGVVWVPVKRPNKYDRVMELLRPFYHLTTTSCMCSDAEDGWYEWREAWAVYHEDPGDGLLLPCLLILWDEDDATITIEVFNSWGDCNAEPHGIEYKLPQARSVLATWLGLSDGAKAKAEEALKVRHDNA